MISIFSTPRALIALVLLLLFAACDKPIGIGDVNQILVSTDQATWEALEGEIRSSLQPRMFTVRNEAVFDVGHVEPNDPGWDNLRVSRQILLIGDRSQPDVASAIDDFRGDAPSAPAVFQVRNLWATNQVVTVLLMEDGGSTEGVRPLLSQLGETYLKQFEDYARARMYVTGADEALADTLRATAGFSIMLPEVYRQDVADDSVVVFRNDQPDPASLIRNITVATRPRGAVPLNAASAVEWRAQLAEQYTQPPQVTEAVEEFQSMQVGGRPAVQTQGVWSNPPGGFPAGGPFIVRMVDCGAQTFLIDAWLYAPGYAKYEYMYQLNTILDTFECA